MGSAAAAPDRQGSAERRHHHRVALGTRASTAGAARRAARPAHRRRRAARAHVLLRARVLGLRRTSTTGGSSTRSSCGSGPSSRTRSSQSIVREIGEPRSVSPDAGRRRAPRAGRRRRPLTLGMGRRARDDRAPARVLHPPIAVPAEGGGSAHLGDPAPPRAGEGCVRRDPVRRVRRRPGERHARRAVRRDHAHARARRPRRRVPRSASRRDARDRQPRDDVRAPPSLARRGRRSSGALRDDVGRAHAAILGCARAARCRRVGAALLRRARDRRRRARTDGARRDGGRSPGAGAARPPPTSCSVPARSPWWSSVSRRTCSAWRAGRNALLVPGDHPSRHADAPTLAASTRRRAEPCRSDHSAVRRAAS